jgi:hypothetical protein
MTALNNQDSALEKLCNATIERRLGDISGLPRELVAVVFRVYREFISSYLNILRQRDNKPLDWTPETLCIESVLTDGMSHFFSDYQHITREFNRLNHEMERLLNIDKESQLNLYQHTIDDILKRFNLQATMRQ